MIKLSVVVPLLTTLGCALMSGLFFAFSIAVMRALAQLKASDGIAAMQAINVAIVNPLFLLVFLGTATGCVATILLGVFRAGQISWTAVAGAAVYLAGGLLVTALFNIPRNNALAALVPNDPASAAYWSRYLVEWTNWNHARCSAALIATGLLMLGLR